MDPHEKYDISMLLFYLILMINSFYLIKFWGVFICIDDTRTAGPANNKITFCFQKLPYVGKLMGLISLILYLEYVNIKNKPLQKGTAKRVPLNCFQ